MKYSTSCDKLTMTSSHCIIPGTQPVIQQFSSASLMLRIHPNGKLYIYRYIVQFYAFTLLFYCDNAVQISCLFSEGCRREHYEKAFRGHNTLSLWGFRSALECWRICLVTEIFSCKSIEFVSSAQDFGKCNLSENAPQYASYDLMAFDDTTLFEHCQSS